MKTLATKVVSNLANVLGGYINMPGGGTGGTGSGGSTGGTGTGSGGGTL